MILNLETEQFNIVDMNDGKEKKEEKKKR